jgi:Ca2+-binding EF-hand superfamily protein
LSTTWDGWIAGSTARNTTRRPTWTSSPSSRPTPEEFLRRRDKDKDSSITLKEFIGNPEGRNVLALNQQFSRRDANKDGELTLEELKNK